MDMKYPGEMNRKGLLHSREDQTLEYAKPACRGEAVTARILPLDDGRVFSNADYTSGGGSQPSPGAAAGSVSESQSGLGA
jgi:hypothetical protein